MPTASVKANIVILWEHEIRIAAKALHALRSKDCEPEDISNALKACYTAIYHPELMKDQPVTVMSAGSLLQTEREKNNLKEEKDE